MIKFVPKEGAPFVVRRATVLADSVIAQIADVLESEPEEVQMIMPLLVMKLIIAQVAEVAIEDGANVERAWEQVLAEIESAWTIVIAECGAEQLQ